MKSIKRLARAFIIATAFLLMTSGIAYAITDPDVIIINTVDAYQSVIETNDQLHIAAFELNYATNPDKIASQTFLFRLYEDGVIIATVTPYAYYDSGYDQGVIAFYFQAADPDIPTWLSDNLTLELMGNPSLDWDGDPPSTSYVDWNSWNTLRILVGAKVRSLATQLESVWVGVNLIEKVQGVNKLTIYGEDYFETVIPNLRIISPEIFTAITTQPDFPSENRTTAYGDTVEERWLTSGNSTYDMTNIASLFGTSRNWITSILWVGLSVGVLIVASWKIGDARGGGYATGMRPALFLFGALMIVGSFLGFMVFEVGLFCGIAGGLALVFTLFWRGSV